MKTHVSLLHSLFVFLSNHDALSHLWLVAKVFLVTAWATSDSTVITHACRTIDNAWLRNSTVLAVHHHLAFLSILWILTIDWHLLKIWNISTIKFSMGSLRHVSAWASSIIGGTVYKIIAHQSIIILKILSLFRWSFWRNIAISSSCTQETWSFVEERQRHLLLMWLLLSWIVDELLLLEAHIGHISWTCIEMELWLLVGHHLILVIRWCHLLLRWSSSLSFMSTWVSHFNIFIPLRCMWFWHSIFVFGLLQNPRMFKTTTRKDLLIKWILVGRLRKHWRYTLNTITPNRRSREEIIRVFLIFL